MLFFIPWITQFTKCRQLLNLADCCHLHAPGQEVFCIDMTNQFPGLKIKWGISGQNRSLSVISTCPLSMKLQASHLALSFFPCSHFTWHFLLYRLKLILWCSFIFNELRGYLSCHENLRESLFSPCCLFYLELLLNHHPPEVRNGEMSLAPGQLYILCLLCSWI